MSENPKTTPRAAMVEVTFESDFREQARDALADDGLMVVHATNVLAVLDDRARLRAALVRLRDCDWTITPSDRMDAVRDIARAALNGEDTRPHD